MDPTLLVIGLIVFLIIIGIGSQPKERRLLRREWIIERGGRRTVVNSSITEGWPSPPPRARAIPRHARNRYQARWKREKCLYCRGKGRNRCFQCRGTGYERTYGLKPRVGAPYPPKKVCSKCYGRKTVFCQYCKGSGYINRFAS